ncbi:3'(2'),5'-bisphosphate nucleotidase CysQ [Pseudanabaena sp. PCC 6802]|uniref:3'(2'),5'-bisphosphate nucleotidase CysQ family protein n=1 Tax=Pseudanabaena sp. PCC 6802 TaxID=118173 RepID=UPI000348C269|nr:inositol monophosphatase family protein [Pseudanabaena sp. PCC 6802]
MNVTEISQFIRQTGQKGKQLRQKGFQVVEKGPGDYVTNVDRALDAMMVEQLQTWFPHDGVISEENPNSVGLWLQALPRYWFIDPIDGTSDFVSNREHYAVMLGLLENGRPTMGWIYAPESDLLFYGGTAIASIFASDRGSMPIQIEIKPPALGEFKVILSEKDEERYGDAILDVIPEAEFYSLGSFGLKVMEVVCGNAAVYIYLNRRVKLWDTVGPLAIARAAGLVCCDLAGNPISFEPEAIDAETLTHHQIILVGWSKSLEALRPKLAEILNLRF